MDEDFYMGDGHDGYNSGETHNFSEKAQDFKKQNEIEMTMDFEDKFFPLNNIDSDQTAS